MLSSHLYFTSYNSEVFLSTFVFPCFIKGFRIPFLFLSAWISFVFCCFPHNLHFPNSHLQRAIPLLLSTVLQLCIPLFPTHRSFHSMKLEASFPSPFGFDHPNNIFQSPQIKNLSLCSFIWLPLILPLLGSNIL